jgi:Flp pilus assembly protein TadG
MSAVRLRQRLRRLPAAREGAAAVEFAFTFPVLLIMLFGMVEIGQLLVAQNRLNNAGASIGDVIARLQTLDNPTEAGIFNAAADIMSTAATTAPDLRVSQVMVLSNGGLRYEWSDAQGTSMPAYAHCATANIAQLNAIQANNNTKLAANSRVLVTEIRYTWSSPLNYVLKQPVKLFAQTLLSPRQGSVTRAGASTTACS